MRGNFGRKCGCGGVNIVRAFIESLEERRMLSAALVDDINLDAQSLNFKASAVVGQTAYFILSNDDAGAELWKTDGTAAGTARVKAFGQGSAISGVTELVNVGGTLFFPMADLASGRELWKSDGTEAGTMQVSDLRPGLPSSNPEHLTVADGQLFFAASTETGHYLCKTDGAQTDTVLLKKAPIENMVAGTGGVYFLGAGELWKSDGTSDGTSMIAPAGLSPSWLTSMGSGVFFVADDGVHGRELWRSDGTAGGTGMVRDIAAGALSSNPNMLLNYHGTLLFSARESDVAMALWRSDGTVAGTVEVKAIRPGSGDETSDRMVISGGKVFMAASTPEAGSELWMTDGTEAGTVLVKDLSGGASGSSPSQLIDVNGRLFFQANVMDAPRQWWRTDGTSTGTDSATGYIPCIWTHAIAGLNGRLIFITGQSLDASILYASNGNPLETLLLRMPDHLTYDSIAADSTPQFVEANGDLYFSARQTEDTENVVLWKISAATGEGSQVCWWYNPGKAPTRLTEAGGKLFFVMSYASAGSELWVSDGTSAGSKRVLDIYPGGSSSDPQDLLEMNDTLFFTADDGAHGRDLWRSDGTAAGTSIVKDLAAQASSPTVCNGALYFHTARELWKTDGTDAGTVLVKNITTNAYQNPYLSEPTDVNGVLYFVVGGELWKSDGTGARTVMVKRIRSSYSGQNPRNLLNVSGRLFFTAEDGSHGEELWTSDGTDAGTFMLKDIRPGLIGANIYTIAAMNGMAFFVPQESASSELHLWRSDGTAEGTIRLNDATLHTDMLGWRFAAAGGKLYYAGADTTHGIELWRTDGTTAGTMRVADIQPGAYSSTPLWLTAVGNVVMFSAYGPAGPELWQSDGTEAGTIQVADIVPGPAGSEPMHLTAWNGRVVFSADDGQRGREPWMSAPWVIAVANAGGPYTVAEGSSVVLAGSAASGIGQSIEAYEWDFSYGDGQPFMVDAAGATPSFSAAGIHGPLTRTIALRVRDDTGFYSDIATTTVAVTSNRPTSGPGGPYTVLEGYSVILNGNGTPITGRTITAYQWDLDYDGATFDANSTFQNAAFSASNIDGPAMRTIGLRVRDSAGDWSDVAMTTVSIENRPPVVHIVDPPANVVVNTQVVLSSGVSDVGGDMQAYVWLAESIDGEVIGNSLPGRFSFIPTAPGTYTITLTVTDDDGGVGQDSVTFIAELPKMTVSGAVFNDVNADGKRAKTEKGIGGAWVYMDFDGDGTRDSNEPAAKTNKSGVYYFKSIVPGSYQIRPLPGAGWRISGPSRGLQSAVVTDRNVGPFNFALTQIGLVTGQVFFDVNENKRLDPGEKGLKGWRVFADLDGDKVWDSGEMSVLTDAKGNFALALKAGKYAIRCGLPKGYRFTAPKGAAYAVTLTSGQTIANRSFGAVK